jgi:hypothetical protein
MSHARVGRRVAILALSAMVSAMGGCTRKDSAADPSGSASAVAIPVATAAPDSAARGQVFGANPTVEHACNSICGQSQKLQCARADECLSNCIAMGSLTPCAEQFGSFYQCLLKQPLQNWECAEDGVASIKPGFCDTEQEAAVRCLETKMAH